MPTRPPMPAAARNFGAEGIGLCRTEHMFFEGDRIVAVREMILADDVEGRRSALAKILPYQRQDFVELFTIMSGLPVTIRLLDPPLHEFLPHTDAEVQDVAKSTGVSEEKLRRRMTELHEYQSDARLPWLPPRHRLPGDRGDAGPRHLRGRRPGRQGDGCPRHRRDHGSAGLHPDGVRHRQGAHRRHGEGRHRRDRRDAVLSGRHHDRTAARSPSRRGHRQDRRVLLLRHQRPDTDRPRHLTR